jgi:hypothetical protein
MGDPVVLQVSVFVFSTIESFVVGRFGSLGLEQCSEAAVGDRSNEHGALIYGSTYAPCLTRDTDCS